MLPKNELHFFDDIAYYHVPFTHCPTSEKVRTDNKCHCNPKDNFDWNGYSCKNPLIDAARACTNRNCTTGTARFFETNNMQKPEGYEKQQ